MKAVRIAVLVAITGMVCAAIPAAFAQPSSAGGHYNDRMGYENPSGPGGAPSAEKREQISKKIEAVKIWRLTETLKLDAETSAKLSALLSSSDQQRKAITRERRETTRELRLTLKSRRPDDAKIQSLLDKLESNDHALNGLIDNERKGLQKILTIEQQARFVIFQQDFKHEMQKMIAGARGNNPGKDLKRGVKRGPSPGPGGPQAK